MSVSTPGKLPFFLTFLYLALVFIRPQEFVDALFGVPLVSGILILAVLSWLYAGKKQLDAPQFSVLAILFGFTIMTVGLSGWVGGMMPAFLELLPIYLLFVLVGTTATSARRQRMLMWLIVACSAMMAIHGIQQHLTGQGWTGEVAIEGRIRYIGIFNDPNDVGLAFVCSLPMATYLLSGSRSWLIKLLLLTAVGIIAYGIVLTNSRGSTLALAALFGLLIWRRYGALRAMILGAMLLPVLFMLTSRLDTISATEASALGRIEAWYEGYLMLLENPLFGVGYNQFTEYHFRTAHNSFVLVLAELGLIGYFLWFSFLTSCALMMLYLRNPPQPKRPHWETLVTERVAHKEDGRREREEKEPDARDALCSDDRAIAEVLFYVFVGFATAAFFLSRSYIVLLFVLCGMAVAHYQGVRERTSGIPPYDYLQRFWFWVMITAATVVLYYFMVKILLLMG